MTQGNTGIVEKQQAEFKYGKYRTELIKVCGEIVRGGKIYRLVILKTSDGNKYYAWRIYNLKGRFIKQLLYPPDANLGMAGIMARENKRIIARGRK